MHPSRLLSILIALAGCPATPAPTPTPLGITPGGVVELAGAAAQPVSVSGPGRLYEIQDQHVVFQLEVEPGRSFPSEVVIPAPAVTTTRRYLFAEPLGRADLPPYDGPGKCPPELPPQVCGVLCIRCQPCCVTPPVPR